MFERYFDDTIKLTKYDVYVQDGIFYLDVMLPGFEKDDISIDYVDKEIIISGTRKKPENRHYQIRKSFFGEFNERFSINFEPETIEASYENGVLSLKLKRNEKNKPKIKFL